MKCASNNFLWVEFHNGSLEAVQKTETPTENTNNMGQMI